MKKLLMGLLLLGVSYAFAGSPYSPEVDARFKKVENLRTARVVYDTATSSGSTGAHGLGVKIPKGAVIKQVMYYVNTAFTGSGGTLALHCEDANNLKTATDITGLSAATMNAGGPIGTAATMVGAIADDCEITATIGGTTMYLAGKLTAYIEYYMSAY